MKTLQVIIVIIGLLLSFNNQIFAIECDFAKYVVKLKEMVATERSSSGLLKDVAIIHYCGSKKPWKYLNNRGGATSMHRLWLNVYDQMMIKDGFNYVK